jgi:hypothetical protein
MNILRFLVWDLGLGAQLPSELWVLMGINAGAFKLDLLMGRTRLWQMQGWTGCSRAQFKCSDAS